MFHVKHPRPAHPSPHQPEHATWTAACPPECLSSLTLVPASRGRSPPRGDFPLNPPTEQSGGPTSSRGHPSGGPPPVLPSALPARRASPCRHRARNAARSPWPIPSPAGRRSATDVPKAPNVRKSSMFHVKHSGCRRARTDEESSHWAHPAELSSDEGSAGSAGCDGPGPKTSREASRVSPPGGRAGRPLRFGVHLVGRGVPS